MRILIIILLILILVISCKPKTEQPSDIIQLEWKDERSTLPARIVEVKEVGRTPVPEGFLPGRSAEYSGPPFWREDGGSSVIRAIGLVGDGERVTSDGQSRTYTWEIRDWDVLSGEITHTVFDPPPPGEDYPPMIFSSESGFKYVWVEPYFEGFDVPEGTEVPGSNPDAIWVYGSDGKLLRRVAIDKSKKKLRADNTSLPCEYPWNSSLLFKEADRIEVRLPDVTRLAETWSWFDVETGSLDRLDELVKKADGRILAGYSEREGIMFFMGQSSDRDYAIYLTHRGEVFTLPQLDRPGEEGGTDVPLWLVPLSNGIPYGDGSIFMFSDRTDDPVKGRIAVRLSDNLLMGEHKAGLLWDNPGPDVFSRSVVVVDPSEQRPYLVQVDTDKGSMTVFDPLLGTIRAQVQLSPPGHASDYSRIFPEFANRTEPRVFVLDKSSNEVIEYKLEFGEPAQGPEIHPIQGTG
jgi:hypothetical protein